MFEYVSFSLFAGKAHALSARVQDLHDLKPGVHRELTGGERLRHAHTAVTAAYTARKRGEKRDREYMKRRGGGEKGRGR